MTAEDRKHIACQLLHRLEEAEAVLRQAEQYAQQLGMDPCVFINDNFIAMQNDAYIEYGKASFEKDHEHRCKDADAEEPTPDEG